MREISKHFKIWMNWVRVKNLEVTYELEVYSERERERERERDIFIFWWHKPDHWVCTLLCTA